MPNTLHEVRKNQKEAEYVPRSEVLRFLQQRGVDISSIPLHAQIRVTRKSFKEMMVTLAHGKLRIDVVDDK